MLGWRWYHDLNTFKVFIHLLFKANYKDGEFENHTIKRGQLVTGRKALSKELEMSERQVRTALEHLKSTNEITITPTSKYSIITINNYDKYQSVTSISTNNRPTTDQQVTNKRPATDHNIRRIRRIRKKECKNIIALTRKKGMPVILLRILRASPCSSASKQKSRFLSHIPTFVKY